MAYLDAIVRATVNHERRLAQFRTAAARTLAAVLTLIFVSVSTYTKQPTIPSQVLPLQSGLYAPMIQPIWSAMMTEPTSQKVLCFLRDMVEYCRLAHREDLQQEYEEAWLTAIRHIYGALPPRAQLKLNFPSATEIVSPQPKTTPGWKKEMLAKPWRKVIATVDDYLVLECGHRVWIYRLPDQPDPRRRRCADCRTTAEAKKEPASASTEPNERKARA